MPGLGLDPGGGRLPARKGRGVGAGEDRKSRREREGGEGGLGGDGGARLADLRGVGETRGGGGTRIPVARRKEGR